MAACGVLVLYIINRQLRREYDQFLPMVEQKASFSDVFSDVYKCDIVF